MSSPACCSRFIPASGDYINAEFLGGANNTMIGNKIQSTYLEQSDYPEAAALSFLMMAVGADHRLHLHPAGRDRGVRRQRGRGEIGMESATATARPAISAGPIRAIRAAWAWLRRNGFKIYTGFALAYMLIPIAVIAVFSFADASENRDHLAFAINNGFTLKYWEHAFSIPDLNSALLTSLPAGGAGDAHLDDRSGR